jgi:membrane protein DedA with SNARE-associated domain
MSTDLLAAVWDGETSVGYPLLFGLVLLGSVIPVVPTGAVVGAAAALATTTDSLGVPLVVLVSTLAALSGDLITFTACRFGGPAAVRWVARGQQPQRLEEVRDQFRRHGWQIIVVGRLLPAGRIPVLLAAGALAYPWRRLLPATVVAGILWAVAYAALGVLSGGIFDSPLLATLLATVLVLIVGGVLNLVGARRRSAAHDTVPDAGTDDAPAVEPQASGCERP